MNTEMPFRFRLALGFGSIADGIIILLLGRRCPGWRAWGYKAALRLAKWRGRQMLASGEAQSSE